MSGKSLQRHGVPFCVGRSPVFLGAMFEDSEEQGGAMYTVITCESPQPWCDLERSGTAAVYTEQGVLPTVRALPGAGVDQTVLPGHLLC